MLPYKKQRMKYSLLFTACSLLPTAFLSAQVIGGELVKLEELFDKGKFEDCAYKAETYTENEKYKKSPEPYLYISMCFYEFHFSDDAKIKEYYKSALKDALKYAVKMKTYDKENNFYNDNKEYLDKLRQTCLEVAKELVDKKDYSKASSYYYKQLVKLDPDDFELLFVKGVCDALMRNGSEAYKSLNDAMPVLKKNAAAGTYKAPKMIEQSLSDAFVNYSTLLKDQSYVDSAKAIIMFGKILLPVDKAVDEQYKKFVN